MSARSAPLRGLERAFGAAASGNGQNVNATLSHWPVAQVVAYGQAKNASGLSIGLGLGFAVIVIVALVILNKRRRG
jgi:hypothetical protein